MTKDIFGEGVVAHAGFPNSAEDGSLAVSLDKLLIQHRASTYLWRLSEPIDGLNWPAGTVVVVDRAIGPRNLDLVVAVEDEAFVIRRYIDGSDRLQTPDGTSADASEVSVWGVVTYVLMSTRS